MQQQLALQHANKNYNDMDDYCVYTTNEKLYVLTLPFLGSSIKDIHTETIFIEQLPPMNI